MTSPVRGPWSIRCSTWRHVGGTACTGDWHCAIIMTSWRRLHGILDFLAATTMVWQPSGISSIAAMSIELVLPYTAGTAVDFASRFQPRPCASRHVEALTEQQTVQTSKTSNKPTRGRPPPTAPDCSPVRSVGGLEPQLTLQKNL